MKIYYRAKTNSSRDRTIKYRKQIQHWRDYKSGKHTLVNRGVRYDYFKKVAPKLHVVTTEGLEHAAKRVLDDELKAGRITGTEYNEQLGTVRRRANLERIKAYGSFDVRSFLRKMFPKKKYEDWDDYQKRIDFLDRIYFQQKTRKENVRNAPSVGRAAFSSLPAFVSVEGESGAESFTPQELQKLFAERGLPIMRGARRPKKAVQRTALRISKKARPKVVYQVPEPQRMAREIEEREKKGERIPDNFYDRMVSGTEYFKYA